MPPKYGGMKSERGDSMELKKNLHWCGALDPHLRVFDIIMATEFGTTYNSYLYTAAEKTVLFETVKDRFYPEFEARLDALVGIDKIDYLVINHTEPDHSGSAARLLACNPNITVVGTTAAIGFLKQIMNREFRSVCVKDGDTLDLGGKTLRFLFVPNLHWPDSMYTLLEDENVLVTCDSFGCHYCHDGILRSTVTDEQGYMRAAKYYFDNIFGPFRQPFMKNAVTRVREIAPQMILPGHGPVLDVGISEFLELYDSWCEVPAISEKNVVIAYVSAYGYTKILAEQIAAGAEKAGVRVYSFDMVEADFDQVMTHIGTASGILLGTPTILGDALEPIWNIVTAMYPPVHGGKHAAAFGSYGWSGEGVPNITERLKQLKLKVSDGYRVRFNPNAEELQSAFDFGYTFAKEL